MVARVMLLYRLAVALGLAVILEQPTSSLMQHHYRFQALMAWITLFRVRVDLGYFGADSQKPIYLYSNYRWIEEILQYQCRNWFPISQSVTTVKLTQVEWLFCPPPLNYLRPNLSYLTYAALAPNPEPPYLQSLLSSNYPISPEPPPHKL